MQRIKVTDTLTRIVASEGCVLRPIEYDDPHSDVTDATVTNPDAYEEVPRNSIPSYTKADYKAKVVELVRERYDQDDECAILRQRDTKPDEFAAYNAYVEQCKLNAKAALTPQPAEETEGEEMAEEN